MTARPFKVSRILQRLVDGTPLDTVATELRTTVDVVEKIADDWGYPVRSRLTLALGEIEAAHRRGSPYPEVDVPLDPALAAPGYPTPAPTPEATPAAAPVPEAELDEPAASPRQSQDQAAEDEEPLLRCNEPGCDRQFMAKRSLFSHQASQHSKETVTCGDCGRAFASTAALGGHRKVHSAPATPEAAPEAHAAATAGPAPAQARTAPQAAPEAPPSGTEASAPARARYDQCDDTCTTDCGHCKGQGRPTSAPATTAPEPTPDPAPVTALAAPTINDLLDQLQQVIDDHADRGSEAVRAVTARLTTVLDDVQVLTVELARAAAADEAAGQIRDRVAELDAEAERIRQERAQLVRGLVPGTLTDDQRRRCKAWAVTDGLIPSERANLGPDVIDAWWLAACPGPQAAAS